MLEGSGGDFRFFCYWWVVQWEVVVQAVPPGRVGGCGVFGNFPQFQAELPDFPACSHHLTWWKIPQTTPACPRQGNSGFKCLV